MSRFQFHTFRPPNVGFELLTSRLTPSCLSRVQWQTMLLGPAHGVGNVFAIIRPAPRATLQICTHKWTSRLSDETGSAFFRWFFRDFLRALMATEKNRSNVAKLSEPNTQRSWTRSPRGGDRQAHRLTCRSHSHRGGAESCSPTPAFARSRCSSRQTLRIAAGNIHRKLDVALFLSKSQFAVRWLQLECCLHCVTADAAKIRTFLVLLPITFRPGCAPARTANGHMTPR